VAQAVSVLGELLQTEENASCETDRTPERH
jgi:hypothetical protein